MIDIIEFQKHGFSHAQIVIRVQPELSINQINKIVSAELPHEQSHLKQLPEKSNDQYNNKSTNINTKQSINEFKDYINERYLSAPEAAWRIFHYSITTSDLSVLILSIHLLNDNIPQYLHTRNTPSSVSLLNRYFLRPLEPPFDNLKYTEYYEHYNLYPYNHNEICENDFIKQVHPEALRKIIRK
ncbi:1453_t:CDS:2 [Racocetra fulgida]|uniref:1453_t:CDS:1 n=1 Tax=Racocetra fulgida TaxID=60492 RepID=A0A9N9FS61_9GLOM|nr:1453_t:CDS:2 [Racocetra fulgida]